jgi:hypothetical protein
MVKKEVKNRVGRPKETTVKSGRISVRFSEDEMKQIKLYLTKHKIESISKLIRLSVKEKVSQTDLFIDSLK